MKLINSGRHLDKTNKEFFLKKESKNRDGNGTGNRTPGLLYTNWATRVDSQKSGARNLINNLKKYLSGVSLTWTRFV